MLTDEKQALKVSFLIFLFFQILENKVVSRLDPRFLMKPDRIRQKHRDPTGYETQLWCGEERDGSAVNLPHVQHCKNDQNVIEIQVFY